MTSNARWTYRTEHNSGGNRTVRELGILPPVQNLTRFSSQTIAIQTVAPIQYTQQVARLNHSDTQCLMRSQCPPTPRIPFLPLPGYPIQYRPRTPDLFPIDLSQPGLFPAQATRLLHLAPSPHHNLLLCNVKTGAVPMTTADLVQFLQHFVGTPLASYAELSPVVQHSVRSISCHGTVRTRAPYGSASPAGPRGSAVPPASTCFLGTRSCGSLISTSWMSRGRRRGSASVSPPPPFTPFIPLYCDIPTSLYYHTQLYNTPPHPIQSCSPGHIVAYSIIIHSPA
ncbi:hypothetical protein FB451DRAFT_1304234 [Mycena latifolia]|nr:hypothetical protein FB451DRAFT_1304234 [Mycena latifolia]